MGGSGGGGGAILDGGIGDVLNLTNIVFSNNQTSAYNGGAISFTGGGTLSVQNSTFINNSSSTGNGGAIHFSQTQPGAFTVVNSMFVGNMSSGGIIGGQGGAINVGCNLCSPFSITGSTFANNTAAQAGSSGGQGGAIMFGAGNLTLNFNRIVGNHAAGGGTGIYGGGGAADATKNWWGCNAGPGSAGCDTVQAAAGTITFNPWLREILLPIIRK
jgi:predicted outer membrane repeat protein